LRLLAALGRSPSYRRVALGNDPARHAFSVASPDDRFSRSYETMSGIRTLRGHFVKVTMALAFALVVAGTTAAHAAPNPRDTVRGFYDVLLSTMKDGPALGAKGRYEKLAPAIRQAFDISYMARMTVGPGWAKLSEEQQQKMTQAFGRFITSQYATNFDSYSGEKLNVQGEQNSNFGRLVQSQIVPKGSEPVQINYLLRQNGDDWQIADVYLSGTISELSVRRSEFSSILRRDGIDGLIRMLNSKADTLVASAQ
jgi:phospholipid transport system substrate-binding protein